MKSYDVVKIKEQFPALNRLVWDKPLIYLDSAASMQKPKKVLDAINKNYSFNYSNVHSLKIVYLDKTLYFCLISIKI